MGTLGVAEIGSGLFLALRDGRRWHFLYTLTRISSGWRATEIRYPRRRVIERRTLADLARAVY